MKENKLIYGVGINDVNYQTQIFNGKTLIWRCPFYSKWKEVLRRCYSEEFLIKNPTYRGCFCNQKWLKLSNFKDWMETQDWEGKQLDKDILIQGNKEYGPEKCVFIDQKVNKFITDSKSSRGEWPVGVTFFKPRGKFMSRCNNIIDNSSNFLGYFSTADQAHLAWLTDKLRQAKILASQQTDERVAKALVERYENYETFD